MRWRAARRRVTARSPLPADDRGSLPLALLVTLVGMTLSVAMGTLVINQLQNAGYAARRVLALHAAQAGLEAALAQVRASVTTDASGVVTGDRKQLPCQALTGTTGAGTTTTYSVTAAYFDADPQGHLQDRTWIKKYGVACSGTAGTQTTPAYAVFTSQGTAVQRGTSTRTLTGTYVFHTANANISGGLVHSYRADTTLNDLCIDAGSGDPTAGTAARMQLCSSGSVSQTWAYAANLEWVLVSSQNPSHPSGMCLDAGTPHAANSKVLLQVCQTTTPGLYRQQWSINDVSNLVGSKSDGSDIDGYCFNVQTPNTPGSYLILSTSCNSGSYNNVQTFSPDANVGAGQASSSVGQSIGQLVNYNQFGRCLDDTGQNINAVNMIAWPCKQNPNAAKVAWNQRYALPALTSTNAGKAANHATGVITTTPGSVYCLQSPMSTAVGQYVMTKSCDGAAHQRWTVYGLTDQYATSYQIVDGTGTYCLAPRDPNANPADLFQTVNKISKIYVAACDGSTLQKWNADKNTIQAQSLKDINEN